MKIGITLGLKDNKESIWTNGIKQKVLMLVHLLNNSEEKYDVCILNTVKLDFTEKPSYLNNIDVHYFNDKFMEMDLIIVMGAQVHDSQLKGFKAQGNKKVVSYKCGNNYVISMESILFKENDKTLVVYTPAIPKGMGELVFFQGQTTNLFKRSEVLGLLTRQSLGLGVAGTHGKTTTSSMLAHILNESHLKCNAFLGGIATNFSSNLVLNPTSEYTVIEADEFDRSFLKLTPFASIITSTDPDHLDIYGDASVFLEGFQKYAALIKAAIF
jgi:UDP-N-acetylmuramate-alanine ligase